MFANVADSVQSLHKRLAKTHSVFLTTVYLEYLLAFYFLRYSLCLCGRCRLTFSTFLLRLICWKARYLWRREQFRVITFDKHQTLVSANMGESGGILIRFRMDFNVRLVFIH